MPLLSTILLLLGPQATSLPGIDGTRLAPGSACYAVLRGDRELGATLQTVEATEVDGVPAWDIVVHQRLAGGAFDLRDHFVLRRTDLAPIRFDSRDAAKAARTGHPHTVSLAYAADHVHGSRTAEGTTTPIDVALPEPVLEGNLWGLTFGALPLAEGAAFRLPFYQYDKGLGSFSIAVTGSETVETPRGPLEAWTLAVDPGSGAETTYLIAKADGAELGARSPGGFSTRLGGNCAGLG